MEIGKQLLITRGSLTTFVLLLLCGIIYPLFLTGVSQLLLNYKANGSIVEVNVSELVGQDFTDSRFMKCRLSAVNYNTYTAEEKEDGTYTGISSGSDNYAASNPELIARVEEDMAEFLKNNPDVKKEDIPTDLLTASGSGLDPHISPKSAKIQVANLVKTTGLTEDELLDIIDNNTKGKFLNIFGEEIVNVLGVNVEIAKRLGII